MLRLYPPDCSFFRNFYNRKAIKPHPRIFYADAVDGTIYKAKQAAERFGGLFFKQCKTSKYIIPSLR